MKTTLIVLVSLVTCTLAVPALFFDTNLNRTSRIIGGSNANRREIPYQVSIRFKKAGQFVHIAGGAIISTKYVLTAAHVVLSDDVTQFKIVAGQLIQYENHPDVQIRDVESIILHPKYPGGNVVATHDIALITLSTDLTWTDAVKPLKMPVQGTYPSGTGRVSGWGATEVQDTVYPTTLQKLNVPIITIEKCRQAIDLVITSATYPLDESMVCTGDAFDNSVCEGDSGGPLEQDGVLIGIVSWVIDPCGIPGAPSVYTNTAQQVTFLRTFARELEF